MLAERRNLRKALPLAPTGDRALRIRVDAIIGRIELGENHKSFLRHASVPVTVVASGFKVNEHA